MAAAPGLWKTTAAQSRTAKQMTNADKIRKMSDEEMAKMLAEFFAEDCAPCPARELCDESWALFANCRNLLMYWLKQEAEDDQWRQDSGND